MRTFVDFSGFVGKVVKIEVDSKRPDDNEIVGEVVGVVVKAPDSAGLSDSIDFFICERKEYPKKEFRNVVKRSMESLDIMKRISIKILS